MSIFGEAAVSMTNAWLGLLVSLPFLFDQRCETVFYCCYVLLRLKSPLSFSGSIVLIGFHFPAPWNGHHIKDASDLRCGLHKSLPLPLSYKTFTVLLLINFLWNKLHNIVCVYVRIMCSNWLLRDMRQWSVRQFIIRHPSTVVNDILSLSSVITSDLSTFADVCTNWRLIPHCSCST